MEAGPATSVKPIETIEGLQFLMRQAVDNGDFAMAESLKSEIELRTLVMDAIATAAEDL